MNKPIGVQLYSVRDLLEEAFESTIRDLARMGYAGVEPALFLDGNTLRARRLFDELGLAVPAVHVELPITSEADRILTVAAELGCTRVVSGLMDEHFATPAKIDDTCANYNQAAKNTAKHGMRFGIHNHWAEFGQADGRDAFELLLEGLDENVFFALDIY